MCGAISAIMTVDARAEVPAQTILKTESFDRDPGWDGLNNHVVLKDVPTVVQDFGYSATSFATKSKGEIGGLVSRCNRPAFYGKNIGAKTLKDKVSASGTLVLKETTGGGGMFIGFFNDEQPGGGGRPMNSLGMDIDGEKSGARMAVRLISGANRSCGTFVTPFIPGKFRPTPLRADGTRYAWTLQYDPSANNGNGQVRFTFKSESDKPEPLMKESLPADMPEAHRAEAMKRFPNNSEFVIDVPEEVRKAGATFDHFGIMNLMKAGGTMKAYIGDLHIDDQAIDLSSDPKWEASGNREKFEDRERGGAHDYGFSEKTNFAGGKPGEIGGVMWRSGEYSYYADRVGPLNFNTRLEAHGKVMLKAGAPDSDFYLGWFDGTYKQNPPTKNGNFIGVHIGAPTRIGHYFQPTFTAGDSTGRAEPAPVLTPGKVLDWSILYDPTANNGKGTITATLGEESATFAFKKKLDATSTKLDHFGLFTPSIGGQVVKIYLDDLKYTSAR
jgi:hypothetical protein